MKTDSESIKKYNLQDFLINTRKFKDYLDYCKKKNLISEKKNLMTELIKNIQNKKNVQNSLSLTEHINNCAFAIIFSDFEVELFLEIDNYNPDLLKMIFIQTINYCIDRQKDLLNYISTKSQYLYLKMKNYNYTKVEENKDSILDNEINESIESLKKIVNQDLFNKSEDNVKILYLKIFYELGVYYYFNSQFKDSEKYLKFLESNMKINQNLQKYLYFDLLSVSNLLKYLNNQIEEKEELYMYNENKNNLFELESIDVIINEDLLKYKNEIANIKMGEKEEDNKIQIQKKDFKEKEKSIMLKYLKISEYLFHISFDNIDNYEKLHKFLTYLNSIYEKKILTGNNSEENILVKYIKKELLYHSILFKILNSILNDKKELSSDFFLNLCTLIQKNTFTDSLRLSGMIHSSLINFGPNYKIIYKYFNDFVEFFNEMNTKNNNKELINQVIFISRIMSVIYIITDSISKINSLEEKEILINIEKDLHINIINIFLFWLQKDKEKNELKYNKYINIIYILVETLKNIDYLKYFKIIVLRVLEYLINKKNVKNKNKDNILINNINDYIKQLKPKIYKINSITEEELKINKKIISSQNLYFSIKINFIETKEIKQYDNNINFEFFICKLFEIVELLENKIKEKEYKIHNEIKYKEKYLDLNSDIDINHNNFNNYLIKKDFLYNFYKIIEEENNSIKKKKFENILIIKKGIDFINSNLTMVKYNYMKNDLINNIEYNKIDIKKIYELFKKKINQEILTKIILCLIKNNLILESIVLVQYLKSINQNFIYSLIRAFHDSKKDINNECCKFIWKINYFEYLANIYNKNNDKQNLDKVKKIIKKLSNHRFFKGHLLRKHFKIINFFNFLEYINSILLEFY